MRRFVSTVLVTVMTMVGAPLGVLASPQDLIALKGRALTPGLQALTDTRVQIRDLKTGLLVNSTTSNATGDFSFENLKPGDYIVELADASGHVMGMSPPFTLGYCEDRNRLGRSRFHGRCRSGRGRRFQPVWTWSSIECGGPRRGRRSGGDRSRRDPSGR